MIYNTRKLIFTASAFWALCSAALHAQPDVPATNPLYQDLVHGGGVKVEEGKSVKLPEPLIADGISAEEEKKSLNAASEGFSLDRFTSDSVNAPQILKIESIDKLANDGNVQQVRLWFIAHGTLKDVEDKKLFQAMAEQEKKEGPEEEARTLTDEELKARDLQQGKQPDGTETYYSVLKANILDKVLLSGIIFSQRSSNERSILVAMKMDERFLNDKVYPCQWQPLDKGIAGSATPYAALGGYAKATELQTLEGALLIEIHMVFAEPHGWFDGRNLLRSKLPPAMQDTVRKFRRKLKQ